MIARRSFVLQVVEKFPECGLLLRTTLQNEKHGLHGKRRRCGSQVVLRSREWMWIAFQHGQVRFIDRLSDQRGPADPPVDPWATKADGKPPPQRSQ